MKQKKKCNSCRQGDMIRLTKAWVCPKCVHVILEGEKK